MDVIDRAAQVLTCGGLVAFPTETVYGLGANALDPTAVRRIFEAKGRPARNPLIVHVASVAAAPAFVSEWPPEATALAERFWPGPLTLVLPKADTVPDVVTAGGPTVGIRMPAHPIAAALIEAAGVPVAAPSANRSSRVSPTRVEHVLKALDGRIDLVLDGGPTAGGIESTVLDVSVRPARLLRPGPVTPAQIEPIIGAVVRAAETPTSPGAPLGSPGLLKRHYAPRARLECVTGSGEARTRELVQTGRRVGWVAFGRPPCGEAGATTIVMPTQPDAYAARLYAALHELDDTHVDWIVVELPPDEPAWLAVRDRLRRAAAPDTQRANDLDAPEHT